MRSGGFLIGLGLACLLACAPVPLVEVAPPRPAVVGQLVLSGLGAHAGPIRFRDASGRLRALPWIEGAPSIQLDPRPDPAWPSFLDDHALRVAREVHEASVTGHASRASDFAVASRLPAPSLDSPDRRW
jgi:hypothetical protein